MPLNTKSASTNFDPLPAGEYAANIVDVELRFSKAENYYLAFTFFLEEHNRKVWGNYMLTEQALWRIKRDMLAIGMPETVWEQEDIEETAVSEAVIDFAVAKEVVLTLTQKEQEYQGKTSVRNEVYRVNPPAATGKKRSKNSF